MGVYLSVGSSLECGEKAIPISGTVRRCAAFKGGSLAL